MASLFIYTLTFKTVPDVPTYLGQLKAANPNIVAVHYDEDASELKIESSVEIYGAEIATIDAITPASVPTDVANYRLQQDKNKDGFDAYTKIVGDINTNGGLHASLDASVPIYKELAYIRMMLKDGMFETALRYWITDIKPQNYFPTAQQDDYQAILEGLLVEYGAPQVVIDAIKNTPAGQL